MQTIRVRTRTRGRTWCGAGNSWPLVGNGQSDAYAGRVDLIVDDGEGAALFAECKWRNEPAGEDVLEKLVYRSELFRRQHKSYVIFSKRGFTQGCQEAAASRGDTKLISFAEMCERR